MKFTAIDRYIHLGEIRNSNAGVRVIRVGVVEVCHKRSEEDDVYLDIDIEEMVVRRSSDVDPK